MLSDSLFQTLQDIEYYQTEYPGIYNSKRSTIDALKHAMRSLMYHCDSPPGNAVCSLDTDLSDWDWSVNPVISLAPDVPEDTLHELIIRWFEPVRSSSGKGVSVLFDVAVGSFPGTEFHKHPDVVNVCKRLVSSGFLALMPHIHVRHHGWGGGAVWAVATGVFDPKNCSEPKGYRADLKRAENRCRELIERSERNKGAPLKSA